MVLKCPHGWLAIGQVRRGPRVGAAGETRAEAEENLKLEIEAWEAILAESEQRPTRPASSAPMQPS